MRDISSREDIVQLVDGFYAKVLKDELIGHFFTEVVQITLEKHMPVMYAFWEGILLPGNTPFRGNPMIKHIEMNKKAKLLPEHFERWLSLWGETIRASYAGPIADEAMRRAKLMGDLMQFKIGQSENPNFVQ